MLIAEIGVRALVALSPVGLPRVGAISLDATVFAFGFGITTLVGLVSGLVPAVHASHSDPHNALQQGSRTSTGTHQLTRRGTYLVYFLCNICNVGGSVGNLLSALDIEMEMRAWRASGMPRHPTSSRSSPLRHRTCSRCSTRLQPAPTACLADSRPQCLASSMASFTSKHSRRPNRRPTRC